MQQSEEKDLILTNQNKLSPKAGDGIVSTVSKLQRNILFKLRNPRARTLLHEFE